MPCYHFTYHGYATWYPDRDQGYVHRTRGLQPRDDDMADRYRDHQRQPSVEFTREHFDVLAAAARGVGCDPTHFHVVVSWNHERTFESMRTSIRHALTRALNEHFEHRTWFSKSPSRKRVRDHKHFDRLMLTYFPKHLWHWVREQDRLASLRRKQQHP